MDQQALHLTATYRCAPNIAWVKYWGKYNEDYILPINDSLGFTLNLNDIFTETTVSYTPEITTHELRLNGKQHEISGRVQKMFAKVKHLIYIRKYRESVSAENWEKYHFKVQSRNSFPTAAGMASSASGLACLAGSLNGLFGNLLTEVELSELARLGSGSAARSIHGGLVRWKGVPEKQLESQEQASVQRLEQLSKYCISHTAVPAKDLQFIKVLIFLDKDRPKDMPSTQGMRLSVQTSQLIAYRNKLALNRLQTILHTLQTLSAHSNSDKASFNTIAQLIIQDSNQFHAICLDTSPPIFYLNQLSKQVMHMIDHCINPFIDYKVGYTFDAGPHAFLFMHEKICGKVMKYLMRTMGVHDNQLNQRAREESSRLDDVEIGQFGQYVGEDVKRPNQLWLTDVGSGCMKM